MAERTFTLSLCKGFYNNVNCFPCILKRFPFILKGRKLLSSSFFTVVSSLKSKTPIFAQSPVKTMASSSIQFRHSV